MTEMHGLYEFLTKGIDDEDIVYLKESYEAFLQDPNASYWLNDTHWVDHPDILYCFACIVVVICAVSNTICQKIVQDIKHSRGMLVKGFLCLSFLYVF